MLNEWSIGILGVYPGSGFVALGTDPEPDEEFK